MKKKIIDLEILDDLEQSGVSAIALVDVPAIEKYWMAFRKEEFVEPNSGESEDDFIPRCVAYNVNEGKPEDQAVAICYSVWENHSKQEFAETYTDYPEEAVENAKRALKYAEENGWGDCGMGPGKARANQLANREPISEDTIARMSAFERHRQNSDTPYGEGCGKLMWDAWGGAAGVEWAARKLREIRGEEFASEEFPTLEEAVKRSEELGLGGEIHSHKTEDGFIYMPGASHEALEKALADLEKFAASPISRIPKEERGREGSAKNKEGDTKTSRGGIEVSQEVEKTLKDKIEEHNKKNTQDSQKADLGMLKAVWRRGAGAYSVGTPGRKGMTRPQWSMGRVNAFLKILGGSAPSDKDYTQDNDLLPKGHPKHSENKMSMQEFAKVSFDYDDTLSTSRGMDLARLKQIGGDDLYIISARGTISSEMLYRAEQLDIPRSRIYATGSNFKKIQKVRELGINTHIDNNADVVNELGPRGLKFDYDLDLPVYVDEVGKKKVDLSLALEYFRALKGLKEEDLEFNGLRVDMETEGMDMEFAAGYTVYRYEGSVGGDTRDFCREMVSDGGFYTFEEIVGFNSDNPGFGPGGSDEYSIFHYKGGPNCKHHWQKYYVNSQGVRENKDQHRVRQAQNLLTCPTKVT